MPILYCSHSQFGLRFHMDFRLLSYFKRVAELGSVTKAAADLGLSQPALTRNIMRLEHDVRARLFVRGHEGFNSPTQVAGS
jgi:DNA-binding transcriptional LysR family regulator